MANVLKMEKQILIRELLALGWSYRRIERETGIRRETISRYDPNHARYAAPEDPPDGEPAKVPTEALTPTTHSRPKCPPASTDRADTDRADRSSSDAGLPLARQPTRVSNAAPFDAVIRQKLDLGLSAQRIYQDLVLEEAYAGSYDSIKRYVRTLKARTPELVARVHVAPGQEAQVDFGLAAPTRHRSTYRRPWLFKMVLSHSRHSYEEAVWGQDVETFIRCHERAFAFFGGVPRVVRLDNLKSAVLKAHLYEPTLNPNYAAFARHAGFFAWPCLPGKPEHKGKVESGIGYTQENALKGRRFESIEQQNAHLRHWNRTWARTRIHGTTKKQVWALFLEREAAALGPLPETSFELFKVGRRLVQPDGFVEVGCAYYAVPHHVLGCEVTVHHNQRWVKVLRGDELLAFHSKAEPGTFVGAEVYLPAHKRRSHASYEAELVEACRQLGESALAWAQQVLARQGPLAQRAIRGVLTLRRTEGAEAVEAACRLALEAGSLSYFTVKELTLEPPSATRAALAQQPPRTLSLTQEHPLIRPLSDYQGYLNLVTSPRR